MRTHDLTIPNPFLFFYIYDNFLYTLFIFLDSLPLFRPFSHTAWKNPFFLQLRSFKQGSESFSNYEQNYVRGKEFVEWRRFIIMGGMGVLKSHKKVWRQQWAAPKSTAFSIVGVCHNLFQAIAELEFYFSYQKAMFDQNTRLFHCFENNKSSVT